MKELKCCVSGHKVQKINWLGRRNAASTLALKNFLKLLLTDLIKKDYTTFISGMATGAETLFAEVVLLLKKNILTLNWNALCPAKTTANT